MKLKAKIKIVIDFIMTIVLLILMAYSLIGETAHEWLGVGMFLLFISHHMLNLHFTKSIFKGKYTPYRIVQTVLVCLIFCTMLGSFISGIILSKSVFSFLQINSGSSFARVLHLLSSYWGFLLMSLHLGLHWNMMLSITQKKVKLSQKQTIVLRLMACLLAVYGIYAFTMRDIGSYMLLKMQFVFFNFDEPLIFFFADYFAVMWLFGFLAHYFTKVIRKQGNIEQEIQLSSES